MVKEKKRQHNSKETRELIIQSAISLFLEKGYSKTSLEDIVQNVQLTRGAFYWNFSSKQEILNEIFNQYEHIYSDLYHNYTQYDSAKKTLEELMTKHLQKEVDSNMYYKIIHYKVESGSAIEDLSEKLKKIDDFSIKVLEKEVQRGVTNKEFNINMNAKQVALNIYFTLIGFENFHSVRQSSQSTITNGIRKTVSLILESLEK